MTLNYKNGNKYKYRIINIHKIINLNLNISKID